MDRSEAILRELNLYPVWVRREPAVQGVIAASETPVTTQPVVAEVIAVTQIAELTPAPVAGEIARPDESCAHADGSEENLFAGQPDAQPFADGGDSLREFQMHNAGGALGRVDWPELQQKVRDCELCKLRAGCTQTVLGSGDAHADWMFIGEAPGVDEDATGEPFVGHAGRLLDNMLLAIKLKREDVYIANVIKCRPPEDRHPHVGEIEACLPYLRRQISLVKPRVIVALGKTAAAALLDTDATIASLRGTVHDYKGIPLIVTFHPAYLLRSPPEKARAWEDLCLAVKTMSKAIL